ncbi:MAG TPA: DNA polymerase IV [Kiritimatiellia bacterium]|nr:DNA polymerase IV [Kiritimatiellia bacterium]
MLSSYPKAIAHIDGDAFFTSVEQAIHPEWKGLPMVTGKERGIIACASYEAKALGIKRGVRLHEAERMCRDLIVVPSDYETYSLYSKRMFTIFRRFTPMVEEHSIDEGFADLTGLRRVHRVSYVEIAKRMQAAVAEELDLTVSVGLSLSKGLAKLASKYRKPRGFTAVPGKRLHEFLPGIPIEEVWGIGPNTAALLRKQGIETAWDFVRRPLAWADRLLGKIGRDLWHELRGESVYPVTDEEKTDYASVSKCKTFTAPSSDREFVYAKLVRNVESALIKLRRHRLRARVVYAGLRRKDYAQHGLEAKLNRGTAAVVEMLPVIQAMFERLYVPGVEYRSTMVVMTKLEEDGASQIELFEDPVRAENVYEASRAVDEINERFGKHAIAHGPGLFLEANRRTARDEAPIRKGDLLAGETRRQRLAFPKLQMKV